ncbi:MAG: GNAT family N-acetyltransferase [Bacteroidales bacterium]|jgi:diamine N-acetyltransferase|nr:GNAT family N-acetyltransferase [Bacteroidales bacterium]
MRVLEGEKVLLKPIEQEDLSFLLDLRWDKEVTEYLIHDAISMQNQQKWFEDLVKKGDLALSIFYKNPKTQSLELAGTIGLYDINHRHQRATLKGTRIHPKYQGTGIVFEAMALLLDYAFNTLNLQRVSGDSFKENKPILHLLETFGFKVEGCLRSHYFHNGKYKDVVLTGLLREEWEG